MLDIIMGVIQCFAVINEYNQMNISDSLEINTQVTIDVTRELNMQHMSHINDLSVRDRQRIDAMIEWRRSMEILGQYPDASPRVREAMLRKDRLFFNHLVNEDVHFRLRYVLRRSMDPASNRLLEAEDYLISRQLKFSRNLLRNDRIAFQLQNCRVKAPSIASKIGNLQDSVD